MRFIAVLDASGNRVAGRLRDGIEPLGSEADDLRFFHNVALIRHVREEMDRILGKVRFALICRGRVNIISFYLGADTLTVITESSISLLIVDRVMEILREHRITFEP